uniref:Uncharacterized protein n=1 Tax=Seriola lalandi dorsalis TaxID=1841481 RepID=A0A3B4WU58_SERLL
WTSGGSAATLTCGRRRTSRSTSTGTASPWCDSLFPQSSQVNGFSPTWNSVMWDLRWDDWVNLLPQVVQRNGRSPVWVTMCDLRCGDWVNLFPHSSFTSSWVLWWQCRPLCSLKPLPQVGHLCGFLLEGWMWLDLP